MDEKMADIIERLRRRDERYEAEKKKRKVCFEDTKAKQEASVDIESQFEQLCIFKAEKIKKRAEDWPTAQLKRPEFYTHLYEGIKSHYLDDLLIKFKKICFKCPLIVMSCYSKTFNEYDDQMTINMSKYKIKPKCFSYILNWIMTEVVEEVSGVDVIPSNAVLEMLNAAKVLKISHLEDQCWYFLQKTSRCNENLAFELYKTTNPNMKEIQHMMLSRICKFFLPLVASEDFQRLNLQDVCALLSLNTLGVNSEMEVFYAAVLWLDAHWNTSKQEASKKIMKCVRFNLMPSWFLVSLNERTGCESVDRIVQQSFMTNMITEAILYTANQLTNDVDKLHLQYKHLPAPVQRRWLFDKSCNYHFRPGAELMEYVTFKMFTDYLNQLRRFGADYWRTFCYAENDHCTKIWKSRPNVKNVKKLEFLGGK